jgi:hypothetical protein
MNVDPLKKIIDPFLTHGICKDETEAVKMLAQDYAHRQRSKYQDRVNHFCAFYQTSLNQFADQVTALSQENGEIPALVHLSRQQQILQAEDDLEEWQAAEQFLVRWKAVEAELQNASAA